MEIILINNIIEFNEDQRKLKNIETDDCITLSFTSCNLLSLLLKHQGDVVSRTEIFINVFDINGSHTTHNNLNQYISSLRKNIKSLGIDEDVIITIPRTGFMITKNLTITKDIEKYCSDTITSDIPKHINKSKMIVMFFTFAISSYICYYLLNYNKTKITKESIPVTEISNTFEKGNCQFNIINNDDVLSSSELKSLLKHFQPYTDEQCQQNVIYYFFRSNIINSGYQKFILKCIGDITNIPGCHSFYNSISGDLK
ncbi:transcriptional regulator [Citrobacter amalonaticus]|uniref:winged helix-turn-helix domain-containing protein n=1 Tax=Citrobacter farmeri TaxID=67824 RepID=UPI00050F43EA|nr:winged helix-turn-helix domain-containing protein [Citrobacter farmeri]MDB2166950.1 winged helix-turn-helix domain-containing protein [Citrobacter farmeri]QXA99842.1 winged helix-turn-helix domain-containing protein [Citrobacter farmeri]GAL51789.1 putative DNA-binding protein [Citrobacter farmeri GTC 1319]